MWQPKFLKSSRREPCWGSSIILLSLLGLKPVPMLASAMATMIRALDLNPALYSLHSLHQGGAMAAHRQGLHQEMVKHHGMWSSDSFWTYSTSLGGASSPVAEGLARVLQATSTLPTTPPPIPTTTPQLPIPIPPLITHIHHHLDWHSYAPLLNYQGHNCHHETHMITRELALFRQCHHGYFSYCT